MFTTRKRTLVAFGAAGALLVGAGSAAAATAQGPPDWAPRIGVHAGTAAGNGAGYGLRLGEVVMDTAADYLGMSETDLMAARHDGSSLAQIATAQGKTVAGLQQALVAAVQTNLDAKVAAGTLTEAQAAQVLAQFKANVQTSVERTATGPQAGQRGAGLGMGFGPGAGSGPGYGMGYGYGAGR